MPEKTVAERGGLTKQQIIAELTRSSHGKLEEYLDGGTWAAVHEPEFTAHLIAWNEKNGQVRDAKIALPLVSLPWLKDKVLHENSLAHLALLDPRSLVRAVEFYKTAMKQAHQGKAIKRLVEAYLRAREQNWGWWERTALQHRKSLQRLYALLRLKPGRAEYQIILNHRMAKGRPAMPMPPGTVFADLAKLKTLPAIEAAGIILNRKIPFLIAAGTLGKKLKEPDLVLALINQMSPTELVTNTKMLERLGVKTEPALRGAYEAALQRAAESKKATFKTTRAQEAMTDEGLKAKLGALQEKQIEKLGGIEGDWLVLGDKSGSMQHSIEVSKLLAATLARMVKGEVHLVFFDVSPRYMSATGMTYEEIKQKARLVSARGGTSIGCGLQYALERGFNLNGIAIVTDTAENTAPFFADVYKRYAAKTGVEPPVYLYHVDGSDITGALYTSMERAGIDMQVYDLRGQQIDYNSLPNLVQTMRASRYKLIDDIMETPLLTVEEALKQRGAA